MPEVYHLLVGGVAEADDSSHPLRLELLWVDGWEHLLQTLPNHLYLSVLAEVIQDHQWVSKCYAEGLAPVVYHILHPAVVHNSESHLPSSNLYESYIVPYIIGPLLSLLCCRATRWVTL